MLWVTLKLILKTTNQGHDGFGKKESRLYSANNVTSKYQRETIGQLVRGNEVASQPIQVLDSPAELLDADRSESTSISC